jgi:hypothetical protein
MTALRFALFTAAIAVLSPPAHSADDAAGIEFFESRVRPVLVQHCYGCHSTESGKNEGSLSVDSRAAIRAGGDRGPAVVPGNPDASWLLTAVSHADADLQMPPRQARLPASVIADLKQWITMGAPDPREGASVQSMQRWTSLEAGRQFWAYRPPRDTSPPNVGDSAWPTGDIDRFILAKLQAQRLQPSVDAEPGVLLRRLHFDLVGLPPSPDDFAAFVQSVENNGVDAALAAEVDRLLATPAFGERWARHWLDVARFGESSGKEANIAFPYAWRYRDYVIDCVTEDMPYDRFLLEQIAGDQLPAESDAERARLLVATGFLAVGTKNLDEQNRSQFDADLVDEQIDTLTRAVMGNSVACARCHDHKFDPFSMQDYYALAGIFASTKTCYGTYISPASNNIGGDPLPLPRLEGDQGIYHASIPAAEVKKLQAEKSALKKEEDEKRAAMWKAVFEKRDASQIFTLQDALRIYWRTGAIDGQLEKVDANGQALPLAMGVLDRETMVDAPLLERGDVAKPGPPVPRGFPRIVEIADGPVIPKDQSGRLALAQWLCHPEHPLTTRVMVNRIWHHLFGSGLVRTVDNFGTTGEAPSHPELLDHLAVRFRENGWSLKRMVREIVLSRTYRQASTFRPDAFQIDPDNRLLWRKPKRRLEAEAIRDAMLVASGEISLERPKASLVATVIGDGPISLIGLNPKLPKDLDGAVYRSIYLPVIRDRLPDVLELFDFAEPSLVTGDRETTNVPLQALYLMNSPFVRARSEALAARVSDEAPSDSLRVQRAFLLCFARHPDADEERWALQYLQHGSSATGPGGDAERERWVNLCQALLCTAEFRNLD